MMSQQQARPTQPHRVVVKRHRPTSARPLTQKGAHQDSMSDVSDTKSSIRAMKAQEVERNQASIRELIGQVQAQERALAARIGSGQAVTGVTRQQIEKFIQEANGEAMELLRTREYAAASYLFQSCLNLLGTDVGREFALLNFQTYNNIAHSYNLQGNVQLSIVNLIKALEFALMMRDLEAYIINSTPSERIPIVETYVNIANAYAFQGNINSALEYTEGGISMAQRIVELLGAQMGTVQMSPERRDVLQKYYYSVINLYIHAFQTKGQFLEKQKLFDQAIEVYSIAKSIVEQKYGHSDRLYIELSNAINGARLRTKYIQHSNLPSTGQQTLNSGKSMPHHSNVPVFTVMAGNSGAFQKEINRMKPISQQKKPQRQKSAMGRQKRVSNMKAFDNMFIIGGPDQVHEGHLSSRQIQHQTQESATLNDSTQQVRRVVAMKKSRDRPSSAKKPNQNPYLSEVKNLEQDRAMLISQLKDMRRRQQEQQVLLNQLLQQNSMTINMQQQHPPGVMTYYGGFQQPYPIMPMIPGHQFPFPGPYPAPNFHPMMAPNFPQYPYPYQQFSHSQQPFFPNRSTGQDQPIDDPSGSSRHSPDKKSKKKEHKHKTSRIATEQSDNLEGHYLDNGNRPVSDIQLSEHLYHHQEKQNWSEADKKDFKSDKKKREAVEVEKEVKKKKEKKRDKKAEQRAVITIQSQFRKWKAQKEFAKVKKLKKVTQRFLQKSYEYKSSQVKGGSLVGLLSAHIELAQGVMRKFPKIKCPNKIVIELVNLQTQKKIFECDYSLSAFGFPSGEVPIKEVACIRFKSLLNLINYTGDPKIDFSPTSFEKAYNIMQNKQGKSQEEGYQDEEIEDNYMNESDYIEEEVLDSPRSSEKKSPARVSPQKEVPKREGPKVEPAKVTKPKEQAPAFDREAYIREQAKLRAPKVQLNTKSLAEVIREKETLNRAALLVQRWYRRFVARRQYRLLKNLDKIQQQFVFQRYQMLDRKTQLSIETNLRIMIELAKGVNRKHADIKYPASIVIQVLKLNQPARHKTPEYSITHLLDVFKLSKEEGLLKEKVCVRVKSILNLIKMTGNPSVDFSAQSFKKANQGEHNSTELAMISDIVEEKHRMDAQKKLQQESRSQRAKQTPSFNDDSYHEQLEDDIKEDSFKEESIHDDYDDSKIDESSNALVPAIYVEPANKRKSETSTPESKNSSKVNTSSLRAHNDNVNAQIAKGQAIIRGFLARKKLQAESSRDFKLLLRTARKFSNGSTYHVFLKGRVAKEAHLQNLEDVLYQLTVRNVEKKNQIYDFHISLMLARQIFKTKTSSQQEIDKKLIVFDRNREGFNALISCVDIGQDSDIVIDYKRFSELANTTKAYFDLKQQQIVEEDDSEVASEVEDHYDDYQRESQVDESYSVHGQSVTNKQSTSKTVTFAENRDRHNHGSEKKKSKYQLQKEREERLVIRIQAITRGYLVRKELAMTHNGDNFRARPFDRSQALQIKERCVLKVGPIYLLIIFYSDQNEDFTKFTVKDCLTKACVISMKTLYMDNIEDPDPTLDDLISFVKHTILEKGLDIILNKKSGEPHSDWVLKMNEFIESEF